MIKQYLANNHPNYFILNSIRNHFPIFKIKYKLIKIKFNSEKYKQ